MQLVEFFKKKRYGLLENPDTGRVPLNDYPKEYLQKSINWKKRSAYCFFPILHAFLFLPCGPF